jgi:hypothetical protein
MTTVALRTFLFPGALMSCILGGGGGCWGLVLLFSRLDVLKTTLAC